MWRHCVFISVIYFRIFFTHAHVALVFPPARKFDLDFLDTARTEKPCGGMPKGDIKTTIPNIDGEKLKVEWHLGYSHKGETKQKMQLNLFQVGMAELDIIPHNPMIIIFQ